MSYTRELRADLARAHGFGATMPRTHAPAQTNAARVAAFASAMHREPTAPIPLSRPPLLDEADYRIAIVRTMNLRAIARPLIEAVPSMLATAEAERNDWAQPFRADASRAARQSEQIFHDMRQAVSASTSPNRIGQLANTTAGRVSSTNAKLLQRQTKAALGIDITTRDRRLPVMIDQFAHQNITLIQSLAADQISAMEKLVANAFVKGIRAEDIQDEIAKRLDIGERHAGLIARDQIGTLNSQITTARHTELGIRRFTWQTMGDDNVRPEHEELDGQDFDYDDPPDEGMPGEPIACRCTAQPTYADILDILTNGDDSVADDSAGDSE